MCIYNYALNSVETPVGLCVYIYVCVCVCMPMSCLHLASSLYLTDCSFSPPVIVVFSYENTEKQNRTL